MFSVVFEVHPRKEAFETYLGIAKNLKPVLETMEGFIDNERFESLHRPGWILSHSTWRDEKSVVRWRTVAKHHESQQRGREEVFQDYRLRVGEVTLDSIPPAGVPTVEQRLDETEVGTAKFLTLTEVEPGAITSGVLSSTGLPDLLNLDRANPALIDVEVFASIYLQGKQALLASWRDRRSAESFKPSPVYDDARIRHRVVRIVRDYGMFDRRESPQYYPDLESAPRSR
jgi:heme-degrading monooxygenase HmoA